MAAKKRARGPLQSHKALNTPVDAPRSHAPRRSKRTRPRLAWIQERAREVTLIRTTMANQQICRMRQVAIVAALLLAAACLAGSAEASRVALSERRMARASRSRSLLQASRSRSLLQDDHDDHDDHDDDHEHHRRE